MLISRVWVWVWVWSAVSRFGGLGMIKPRLARIRPVVVVARFSIPRRLRLCTLITFVGRMIAHQRLQQRDFEIDNGIKKRHLALHKLIERGSTA